MANNDFSQQLAQLQRNLLNVGSRVSERASERLDEEAEAIVFEAKRNSPHDTGSLESSIDILAVVGSEEGKREWVIGVDPLVYNPEAGKTVGHYAEHVHDNMEPYGEMRRGLGTWGKGEQAGGGYMERAYMERVLGANESIVLSSVEEAVKQVVFDVR